MGGLSFAQPLGLVSLLLPLAYLLFVRHVVRPETFVVGSLALWRRVAQPISAAADGGRLTWRTVLLFLALTAVALAAAGPRLRIERADETWTLVLGTGPGGGLAAGEQTTRLEVAVELGLAFEAGRPRGDRLLWIGSRSEGLELASGQAPPADFLAAARAAGQRDWTTWDRPDCVWLPVSGAGPLPRSAGLARARLKAAPGPVARTERGTWVWDGVGESLQLSAAGAPPLVRVAGAALAQGQPLRRVVEAWALGRSAEVVAGELEPQRAARVVLEVVGPSRSDADPRSVAVGRDGWLATVELGEALGSTGLQPFLEAAGVSLAAAGAGRVEVSFSHMQAPRGDPAAFAVSWAELFDVVERPPQGVVAVAERRAAEPARIAAAGAGAVEDSRELPLAAPLALLAALLLLVARRH